MTKITIQIKDEKKAELIKAILDYLGIEVVSEEVQEKVPKSSVDDFYGQFGLDLSNFKFDREEANAR